MKFVAFSDPHIGGKFNEDMFKRGINLINTIDSDYVICGGDLTDQGTVSDYEKALEYMKLLKKPYFIVPGNHDSKNVGDLLYEEIIGPRFFVKIDNTNKVKILGLDSTEPDRNTGWLGPKGVRRIYEEFEILSNDWIKVLVFHHQSLPIPYTGRERSALNDAGDTIKAILDCDINLVLNGHRHISNQFRLTDGDIKALIVNVGTLSCRKTRYREEYSITVVDINSDLSKASVEVILLNKPEPVHELKFSGSLIEVPPPEKLDLLATIVQIGTTDFSFSEEKFNLETFAKGIKLINSIQCDLVVHCGNITNASYLHEFQRAKTLLQQILKPSVVLPGPQDAKPLGFDLFPEYIGDMNPQFVTETLDLYGFNTCILDETEGRLGRSNSRLIEEKLKGNNKITAVAFHHTIIPLPRTKHEAELTDAGDILALLVKNKINLVLTGAKNRPGTWQVDETVFVNAGTLSSFNINTRSGNSFNIISIYETEKGKYYQIDEVLLEDERAQNIGNFHIIHEEKIPKKKTTKKPTKPTKKTKKAKKAKKTKKKKKKKKKK
ncbi:MAG: metallophosphoesterase family protein [Candidatus Hodarchaeales archaeon]|jgi:3',5'-cyclic AMP phosphodiesterase CpdA